MTRDIATKMAWRVGYGVGSLALVFSLAAMAMADEQVPTYRLHVGQELMYHGTSHFQYDGGSHEYEMDWRFWVVDRNEDGSWRLVLKQSTSFGQGAAPRVNLAYFDMFPDGRIVPNASLGYQVDPAAVLVRLPADAGQLEEGWQSHDEQKELQRAHRVAARPQADPAELNIEVVNKSPMDEIYLSTSEATVTFDRERGLVERIETRNTQGYGFNGKGTGEVNLESAEVRDEAWISAFREDSQAYVGAQREYEALTRESQEDATETTAVLDRAKAILEAAREKISSPELQALLDANLEQHDRLATYYEDSARRRAEVLGKPAYEFDTEDLEGNPHKLSDFRGKVVILDFWYRGCGWCIRAMPQVKEVAEHYQGRPVVVLGMNTDQNQADAELVVEKMRLTYANLKADGLPEKYGVRGFPTLIIIDQEGKVHDIHVGYSPDLAEKVSQTVDELLAGS